MLGSLLSTASSALRNPYGLNGSAVTGVRLISPVVRGVPDADRTNTRFSPTSTNLQGQLYNRSGGLNTASYQASGQSLSYQRKDTFDLRIETADGDIATIRIAQQQSIYASTGAISVSSRAGQTGVQALSLVDSDTLNVNLSVDGKLSAEETAAINALVSQVDGVAEEFFAGDVEQATQAAREIGFGADDTTLSAYQFSLQSQESLRAVAVYERVATSTAPAISVVPAPGPVAATETVARAPEPKANFLQSLRAMLSDWAQGAKDLPT